MYQESVVDHFKKASIITVGCKDRINNLVTNAKARVAFEVNVTGNAEITFATFRTVEGQLVVKKLIYVIPREKLTDEQLEILINVPPRPVVNAEQ